MVRQSLLVMDLFCPYFLSFAYTLDFSICVAFFLFLHFLSDVTNVSSPFHITPLLKVLISRYDLFGLRFFSVYEIRAGFLVKFLFAKFLQNCRNKKETILRNTKITKQFFCEIVDSFCEFSRNCRSYERNEFWDMKFGKITKMLRQKQYEYVRYFGGRLDK
jgi:uncharacterized membrane protein